ncbi:hypothetical protein [Micromonospora echinofusca]
MRKRQPAGEKAIGLFVANGAQLIAFGCLPCRSGYLTLSTQHAITSP